MNRTSTTEKSVWSLEEIGAPSQTRQVSVCIVGGGGSGMVAALQCAELGLDPVIIEQRDELGGTFVGTEFITSIGSAQQRGAGIEDSVRVAVDEHLAYHHFVPSRKLAQVFLAYSLETAEWLASQGVGFTFAAGYKKRAIAFDEGKEPMRGIQFVKRIASRLKEYDVSLYLNTRACRLLYENGCIKGVLAKDDKGRVTRFDANAVVLATGGYANNNEFRAAVSQATHQNVHVLGVDCRQADGIKMAANIGAAMAEDLDTIQWSGPLIRDAITADWQTDAYCIGVQPVLWINQDAERFVREDLWRENFPGVGMCFRNQERTFMVFSDSQLQRWERGGPTIQTFAFGVPGTPMPHIRRQLESLPSAHFAASLEELATAVGLDAEKLTKTVARYDGFCLSSTNATPEDRGIDEDFGKQAQYLDAIGDGPFWLCETSVGIFSTLGGVRINEHMEALTEENQVVKGLYVVGCDAGGLHGDSYDVLYCPGSVAGWAVNSGRLAAKAAACYLRS